MIVVVVVRDVLFLFFNFSLIFFFCYFWFALRIFHSFHSFGRMHRTKPKQHQKRNQYQVVGSIREMTERNRRWKKNKIISATMAMTVHYAHHLHTRGCPTSSRNARIFKSESVFALVFVCERFFSFSLSSCVSRPNLFSFRSEIVSNGKWRYQIFGSTVWMANRRCCSFECVLGSNCGGCCTASTVELSNQLHQFCISHRKAFRRCVFGIEWLTACTLNPMNLWNNQMSGISGGIAQWKKMSSLDIYRCLIYRKLNRKIFQEWLHY